MKPGDSSDLILAALAVSLVLHVALMFFMSPRVMTHVEGMHAGAARREAITVGDALPPPESVRMDVLDDVEASREAPTAEAADDPGGVPMPTAANAPDAAPPPDATPLPAFETSSEALAVDRPVFSETFEVIVSPDAASPIVGGEPVTFAPTAAAAPHVPVAVGEVTVPAFVAPPVLLPQVEPGGEVERLTAEPAEIKADFTPSAEVYEAVDEQIVEAEKAAVRTLVDAPTADDLCRLTDCALACEVKDGWRYFKVTLRPKPGRLPVVSKDVVLLLDASGSIGRDRLKSCRNAAQRILRTAMNTGDRFNLVAFRDRFTYAFRTWQPCGRQAYAEADRWLGDLAAYGRTDVFSTIRSVLTLPRDPVRPLLAVVVTDGEANVGVRETAAIISKFTALNDGLVSVYMYGVKSSANVTLIDILTRGNRGEGLVHTGSRWAAGDGLEGLSERFRDPVLTDIRVVFAAKCLAEVFPERLKNLYMGNAVEIYGRMPMGASEVAFSLKGLRADKAFEGYFRLPVAVGVAETGLAERWEDERRIARMNSR